MPSSITHAYIAKDITNNLSPKIRNKIDNHLEEYKTFSQGMDILYFYKILNQNKNYQKIRDFGSLCHHIKTNELFINIIEEVKKSKNIQQFMFLIGLITHYVSDITLHPFVNYKSFAMQKKNFTEKDAHFLLETYLDNYMINKKEDTKYKNFKGYDFCYNANINIELIEMLNRVFKKTFDVDNIGYYYKESLKDNKSFFKYFRYDKFRIKWCFYNTVNPLAKRVFRDVRYLSYNFPLNKNTEFLNLKKEEWFNINDPKITSNENYFELYEKIIPKASNMIEKVYEYIFEDKDIDLNKLLENRAYGSGLIIRK